MVLHLKRILANKMTGLRFPAATPIPTQKLEGPKKTPTGNRVSHSVARWSLAVYGSRAPESSGRKPRSGTGFLPRNCRHDLEDSSQKEKGFQLSELFFAAHQRPNPFGQKGGVKGFAERFVEQRAVETAGVVIIG